MMEQITLVAGIEILIAYLFGSLSTAIIVCKLMSLPDPRGEGSGNPGATNVLRFGGKKAAALTLFGDAIKGVIPVLIAIATKQPDLVLALVGFAAFLGHLYPVFFRFQGGKGVATAAGVFFAISWLTGLALLATWLLMAYVFKISSLSALVAASLAPLYVWFFEDSPELTVMCVILSVMLIVRHRSNIKNLLSGREGKIQ